MPKWVPFIEEPCHDFFGPGEIPGFLLFHHLGRPDDVEKAGAAATSSRSRRHQLRFHLYMAKFLPAKDENGLSDPYVLVKYYGKTLKSSVKAGRATRAGTRRRPTRSPSPSRSTSRRR